MATELLPDGASSSSPRISFSSDFFRMDTLPTQPNSLRLQSHSSNLDPDFCFTFKINQDQCPSADNIRAADELFNEGKILPIGIKKTITPLQGALPHQLIVPSPFSPLHAFVNVTARIDKNPERGSGDQSSEGTKTGSGDTYQNSINQESLSTEKHFRPVKIKKNIATWKKLQQPIIPSPFPPLQSFYKATPIKEWVKDDRNPRISKNIKIFHDNKAHCKQNSHISNGKSTSDRKCLSVFCPFTLSFKSKRSPNHKQNPAEKFKAPIKKSSVTNQTRISDYHVLSLFTMDLLYLLCVCFLCRK